jgi:catechol 2,3-dioxygenase-like lactoylglutathione lyase family enzyme
MIDFQQIFHIGVRVGDLDTAMREFGDGLGLTWAEVRDNPAQTLWTPQHGLQHLHLRYTYSAQGPQHVELLEGPPGSFWDGRVHGGAHHVGVWVDSVTDETDRLVAAGWTLVGARADPAEGNGYGVFSYVQPPSGLIVELVDRSVLPYFESWWSTAT